MNLLQEWSGHWLSFFLITGIFLLSLLLCEKCSKEQRKIEEHELIMEREEENGTMDSEELE